MQPSETEIDYGEDVIFVTSTFSDAYKAVTNEISNITKQFGDFAKPILFFSSPHNFGKKFPQITRVIEMKKALRLQTCHTQLTDTIQRNCDGHTRSRRCHGYLRYTTPR